MGSDCLRQVPRNRGRLPFFMDKGLGEIFNCPPHKSEDGVPESRRQGRTCPQPSNIESRRCRERRICPSPGKAWRGQCLPGLGRRRTLYRQRPPTRFRIRMVPASLAQYLRKQLTGLSLAQHAHSGPHITHLALRESSVSGWSDIQFGLRAASTG